MKNRCWLQDGAADAERLGTEFLLQQQFMLWFCPPPPHYLQFHHPPLAEAFVTSCITAAASLGSFQYCKAWSHLALDRGACQPHTVIMPELTSPFSIELLSRWRGHEISCSEKQHCSCPSGLWENKKKKIQNGLSCTRNHPPANKCCWVFVILQANLVHLEKIQIQYNPIISPSDIFVITTWLILGNNKERIWGMWTRVFS